jgi:phospholipid/cholesterol/gamma-HCH transport system permease protein
VHFSVTNSSKDSITLACSDDWTKETLPQIIQTLPLQRFTQKTVIDCTNIKSFDTAAAVYLLELAKRYTTIEINDKGNEKVQKIFSLCKRYDLSVEEVKTSYPFDLHRFEKFLIETVKSILGFISFTGGVCVWGIKTLLHPRSLRVKSTLFHLQTNGFNATGIIALTSFLIGIVIAYQAAVQLKQFGANIFIVEMVAISATRELAPLIAAIVIAGRSASAYTAQIGVMKLTEEVDAMKTMGYNPWRFLIIPRVFALVVALPILVILADFVAVFGGMVIAKVELGIGFIEFLNRFQESVALKHIVIGLVKAPVFGLIIALIGCYRGFQISSNTQSVGRFTTISVVNAIFWVIVFDALFSVVLTELGI